jgi:hypothetical protein
MNRVKEEARKRRYAKNVNGEPVDLREGVSLTFEEWNKRCTEANPLDSYLKEKREKEAKDEGK